MNKGLLVGIFLIFVIACTVKNTVQPSPSVDFNQVQPDSLLEGLTREEWSQMRSENEAKHLLVDNSKAQVEKILRTPNSKPEDCKELPLDSTMEYISAPGGIAFPDLIPGRKTCYFMMAVKLKRLDICDTFGKIETPNVSSWSSLPSDWAYSGWIFDDYDEMHIFSINGHKYCKAKVNDFSDMEICSSMDDLNELFESESDRRIFGGSILKSLCISKTISNLRNPELCESIREPKNETSQQDGCYSAGAKSLKMPALCEKIKKMSLRGDCLSEFAREQNDLKFCEILRNIADDEEADGCIHGLVKSTKNGELCKNIKDGSDRDSCYSDIAGITKNFNYCHPIEDFRAKDTCLFWIAQITRSPAGCGQISVGELKGRCLAIR